MSTSPTEATSADQAPLTPPRTGHLVRFDRVERAVHWVNALLFIVLIATGAALYFTPLIALVGRRRLIEQIHLYSGLALPLPLLAGLAGSWGRALRRDAGRINRWSEADLAWLRGLIDGSLDEPGARAPRLGKFNPGQKLNAAFVVGAGLVMLGTGALLRWYQPFPLAWRSGATFVHNWLAVLIFVTVTGHIGFALSHPEALRGMLTGRVSRAWAARHAPAWLEGRDD